MEKLEFSASMVRGLKGAPISCLILMAMVGQPVTAQYLERNSGYSDKSVNAALLLLQENGLITRNERYAWRIAINVRQLPLMVLSDEENVQQPDSEMIEKVDEIDQKAQPEGSRRNSESEKFRVVTSSRSIDLTSKELINLPLLDSADPENLRVAENLEACDRFGIGEPKRSVMSKNSKVFPRMIYYHCEKVKQEGQKIGAAIFRIEHDWKVPQDWIDPKERQDQNVCAQTFSQAEFVMPSEWVELWDRCLESVRSDFKKVEFETWLHSAKLCSVDGDGWTIRVGNRHAADWIKEHALERLQSAAGVTIKVEW